MNAEATLTIDLTGDGNEAQVAIRHPDGQVIVFTVKAHRGTVTAILPPSGMVRDLEDTGDVAVAWRLP